MTEQKTEAVLVIGAGVSGIRAAFDLAESGLKVYLIDKAQGIGGTITQLTTWFPDNQCEMCKLLPVFNRDDCSQFCLRRDIAHPNIELITGTRVETLEGDPGNFIVSIVTESHRVKKDRCIACGKCSEVCPVEVSDEFEHGLKNRKAIYVRNPQAVPNIYAIDPDACTLCGECVKVCPTDAIDLDMPEEKRELAVGAVIVSSGFDEYKVTQMGQYGFERYQNVLTNIQLERELASAGATDGKLSRASDGKEPKNVAILQCIGSRDMKHNYCSSACCMYALKESILIKEYNPGIDVTIYYMDIRAFGKEYYRDYMEAKALGVNFVRCRVSTLRENPQTKNLLLVARAENGELISTEYGMVILSAGQCPSNGTVELSKALGIERNKWGFIQNLDYEPVQTSREGVFVCGSASSPSDIAESVLLASAAAGEAVSLLRSQQIATERTKRALKPGIIDEKIKIAVYLCKCGDIIPSVINYEKVSEYTRELSNIVDVEEIDYLCLPESIERLKESVKNSGANRVILAACAPYRYYRMFNEAMTEAGIDASLWQLVNFREQVAWVHNESPALATEKACSLLAIAATRLGSQEKLIIPSSVVRNSGLVIGGGISGLIAALNLAEKGFEVTLVENTEELGGHVRNMYISLGNSDPQAYLKTVIDKVTSNSKIHLYMNSEVADISGHAGNFKSAIKSGDKIKYIEHGAVIIATGAQDYQPSEYHYGQDERIITQKTLQEKLLQGNPDVSSVVMIQCVGSRDDDHPYCNRTCCSDAIANALKIKELSPATEVYILNRDIMTYGFREEYYTRAREAGVVFLRYEQGKEPELTKGDTIIVTVTDPGLPGKVEIETDLLVLSTGIVAADNIELAGMLSLDLTEEGFFKEVDIKFRPVDAVIDGVYITGRACAPRNLDEEITQAKAASQRAANVLSRKQLESGRIISEVNARRCSTCGLCVEACPFNARWLDRDSMVAVVKETLCQGCGTCVAVCPNSAAKLRGMKDKQVFSMIDAAF